MNTGADLASQIPGAAHARLYDMPPIDPSLITAATPTMMPDAAPFNRPNNTWASPLQEQMARLNNTLQGA